MDNAELRLINVNKKYKLSNKQTFQALYDINVEFERGELVSIVGESGSGKSTLMNLIGGLDSDFTGQIISGGEDLKKLSEKELDKYRKNKVGFVFQSFNLISHLSILDNVTLALTLSNVGEKEKVAKATEILRRVGLESQLKKKPSQLSGGQKQRVAIARALINDPEIIIADEPTGALDSETSMQILEILKEIADSGKLVIMVTHSEKVAAISSRVVKLSDGRIVDDIKNENYEKSENALVSPQQDTENEAKEPKKKTKNSKEKQNLSFWSAIKLSWHNMWASKIKNLLMSFGVAIGIGSLILMMSFSSGITDFISKTMKSYSNPTIVSITKKSQGGASNPLAYFDYNPFDDEQELAQLYSDINDYLEQKEIDFRVEADKVAYGFQMFTAMPGADAKLTYSPSQDYNQDPDADTCDYEYQNVFYLYTIPPYYTQDNILDGGTMSSTPSLKADGSPVRDSNGNVVDGGGFMFTKKVYELLGEDAVGKEVRISFNFATVDNAASPTNIKFEDKVSGVIENALMGGNSLVAYVDYNYLKSLFIESGVGDDFAPTVLYIETPSEKITDEINAFLRTEAMAEKYSGSIEDQLEGLFTNISSVIGTSLVVISSISLLVSAMMILVVLYMSVSERTKEIGVLKSIGARRKDIKRIFTSESFLIGLLSGIVGMIYNGILTVIIWVILESVVGFAPISYRWWYFVVALGVSIVISMLAGLYPASKAAKLDPVESLRRE